MRTALEIYQDHLDEVSIAIWEREFEALTKLVDYPHDLLVEGEVVQVSDPKTLIGWSVKFRDRLEELGATAYHRVAIAAAFTGDEEDRIDGFHRVYALNGATQLIEPYSSEARLHKKDGVWLGVGLRASLRQGRYVINEETDS